MKYKLLTILFLPIFIFLSFSNVLAASANFSVSGGGTYYLGSTISVTVSVSGSDAYNAVTTNVSYSNLTLVSSSATSNWTTVAGPTDSGGNISYTGAVLGSSYTGSRSVLSLKFRAPSSPSNASISASGTIALADGSGTKVTASAGSASYKIVVAPTTAPPTPTPIPPANAVVVSSSTNPDPSKWYKSKDITLYWNQEAGVTGFSYILDNNPSTIPDDTIEGTEITKTYNALNDGIYYFHIKATTAGGFGPVTNFQLNINTVPPQPFTITSIKDTSTGNYTIYFATNGTGGISQYTATVDGKDLGPQQSGFQVPANTKTVEILAYDNAGNITSSKITLSQSIIFSTTVLEQNSSNNNFSNPWIIVLVIIASLLFVYASIITTIFVLRKIGKEHLITRKKDSLSKKSDSKVEETSKDEVKSESQED